MTRPTDDNPSVARTLREADAEAIDVLLQGTTQSQDAVDPERLSRAKQLLGLLDTLEDEQPPADLASRTLQRVAAARTRDNIARQVRELTAPTPAFRWTEFVAVAAVLMIAVSLIWPLLTQAREGSRQTECRNHMKATGMAIGRWAGQHGGFMPHYNNVQPGQPWWKVGAPVEADKPIQSNSANLYLLVRQDFTHAENLICPSNENAPRKLSARAWDFPDYRSVSYSYQNQFTPKPIALEDMGRTVILSDKNPLLLFQRGGKIYFVRSANPETAVSQLHGASGQNVLFADGGANWTESPVLESGDNIWMPEGVDEYRTFTEAPKRADDGATVP